VIVLSCSQRSEEWHRARLGRLCASYANDFLAQNKTPGDPAARKNLKVRLVLERVTGKSQESGYVSQDMQNGIDREADALALYEAQASVMLCYSGFVIHDTLMAGWSPDGHTHDWMGFVEAKAPKPATHYETLRSGKVPLEYLRQMIHGGFWIGGAEWGDYVSYHPDFPESVQLFVKRIYRRDLDLEAHEKAVRTFLDEVDRECEALRTMTNLAGVLQEAV
jgi:hypothetical protein